MSSLHSKLVIKVKKFYMSITPCTVYECVFFVKGRKTSKALFLTPLKVVCGYNIVCDCDCVANCSCIFSSFIMYNT